MKNKINILILLIVTLLFVSATTMAKKSSAAEKPDCVSNEIAGLVVHSENGVCPAGYTFDESINASKSNVKEKPIETDCEGVDENDKKVDLDKDNCAIIKWSIRGINFLSAITIMVIIGSIMFAGFQYMTAMDNSQQIAVSRNRIIWSLVALFMFIFMYAFLNWLVPGGVL